MTGEACCTAWFDACAGTWLSSIWCRRSFSIAFSPDSLSSSIVLVSTPAPARADAEALPLRSPAESHLRLPVIAARLFNASPNQTLSKARFLNGYYICNSQARLRGTEWFQHTLLELP